MKQKVTLLAKQEINQERVILKPITPKNSSNTTKKRIPPSLDRNKTVKKLFLDHMSETKKISGKEGPSIPKEEDQKKKRKKKT